MKPSQAKCSFDKPGALYTTKLSTVPRPIDDQMIWTCEYLRVSDDMWHVLRDILHVDETAIRLPDIQPAGRVWYIKLGEWRTVVLRNAFICCRAIIQQRTVQAALGTVWLRMQPTLHQAARN